MTAGGNLTEGFYDSSDCSGKTKFADTVFTLNPCSSPQIEINSYGKETTSIVSPEKNPSRSASCFSGSETVTVASGEVKEISKIRSGDFVLASDAAGKLTFSEVVFVPHGSNEENALFAHIFTVNGYDLKMTQNHILPAGPCGSSLPLAYASQISAGDCIQTISGEVKVSKVELWRGQGVYTIVTNEEFIVVNGIVASSFGANHMLANLYYNAHRFIYASAPVLLSSMLFHRFNEVRTLQYLTVFMYALSQIHVLKRKYNTTFM